MFGGRRVIPRSHGPTNPGSTWVQPGFGAHVKGVLDGVFGGRGCQEGVFDGRGCQRVCSGRDMLVVYLVGGAIIVAVFSICNDSGT